jgi:protein-tyrosine-phosphatase
VSATGSDRVAYDPLGTYIDQRTEEFDRTPRDRKRLLEELARYVTSRRSAGRPAKLTFVCTHNSRRSQMSQLWAQTAAAFYGVDGVETYSGGTEATAFDPRAVAALERAGFRIERVSDGDNPIYEVRHRENGPTLQAFSKVYDQAPNPREDFCAVMTCTQAEAACPVVRGASKRVAIPYEDPKAFDGTARESAAYDEGCRQISREMLYLFSRVAEG